MKLKSHLFTLAMIGTGILAMNAADDVTLLYKSRFNNGEYLQKMSDNAAYAVFQSSLSENTQFYDNAKLVDLSTGKSTNLKTSGLAMVAAFDVSNDGQVVVGSRGTRAQVEDPAAWVGGSWMVMEMPSGTWEGGHINAVTPDGTLGVGLVYDYSQGGENYGERGVLWEIETGEIIPTPNMPTKNLAGEDIKQIRFTDISSDGKRIIGVADFSYLGDNFSFVYDRDKEEWTAIGFEHRNGQYKPLVEGLEHTEDAYFSPDGKYIFTDGYFVEDMEVMGGTEYYAPFLYSYATGKYTTYSGEEYKGSRAGAVDNQGNVYISNPYDQPIRTWYVRSGNYWVSGEQILSQIYNTNVDKLTGYNDDCVSGTVMGVDETGTVLACIISASDGESYVVKFPTPVSALGGSINLLDSYTVTPAAGSVLSSLRDFTIRFDREVEIAGKYEDIAVLNEDGSVLANAVKCEVSPANGKLVELAIRKKTLADGKKYTLSIPAGMFQINGDANYKSAKMEFEFKGRASTPVKMTAAQPAAGSQIARFNMSGDPIVITFDANVKLGDDVNQATFNQLMENGTTERICQVGIIAGGNQALLYPVNDQFLYKGNNYRIVVEAGTFTDVQGECANEMFTIDYVGSYVREINANEKYLFQNDFNDGTWLSYFMFYEGDNNTPTDEMKQWGFENGEQYPWWIVRDSDSSENWALASHSMYTPAGQSNDWLIIPQTFIPDGACALQFKSQSYKNGKEDHLKVYVLETDVIHNYANEQFIGEFLKNGTVIYDEIQSPGKKEDTLEGDWRDNGISLAEYAGKNIYLAFVNDNNNQSAVMIDDVAIVHNMDVMIALDTEAMVVGKNSVPVNGRLVVESATETYKDIELTLSDYNGKVIDTLSAKDVNLKHGDVYTFKFSKEVPVKKGEVNVYNVTLKSGDLNVSVRGTVSNLSFQPVKRVVLEEGTGQGCTNCPLGHEMITKLHDAFGDRFIPVAIHTYTGDNLASGLAGYTGFLGINAYPSAVVNRRGNGSAFEILSPMATSNGKFIYTSQDTPLWWDVVASELSEPTFLDIEWTNWNSTVTTPTYFEDTDKFYIPVGVRYALNAENMNHNIFCVILEDGLPGYQINGMAAYSDPVLGEWGKGGLYGQAMVDPFIFDHVARAIVGQSMNGTSGLIPSTVKAGELYSDRFIIDVPSTVDNPKNCGVATMIIDNNTGMVVNARYSAFAVGSGVQNIGDDMVTAVKASVEGHEIVVTAANDVAAQVFGVNGAMIAAGTGNGELRLNAGAYKGVVIVRIVTERGVETTKLIVK